MKSNIMLALGGVTLLLIAFFRSFKIDGKFIINTVPIVLVLCALIWANNKYIGKANVVDGYIKGYSVFISLMPVLIITFLTMGQAMAILDQYKSAIEKFLTGNYGLHGTLAAAAITPGSLTGLPIVKDMWYRGISHPCLILFLITSPLINWQMIFFKLPMLGWKITFIQFVFALINSLLMMGVCKIWMSYSVK